MNGREFWNRPAGVCEYAHELSAVLGSHVRMKIVRRLARGGCPVTALADAIRIDVPHLSHNLSVLRHCCLVNVAQQKKFRIYSLSDLLQTRLNARGDFVISSECLDGSSITLTLPDASRRS